MGPPRHVRHSDEKGEGEPPGLGAMRPLLAALVAGLALLAVPVPAQAVLCDAQGALEDPLGYAGCQFGCAIDAIQRLDPFVACPL